MTSTAGTFKSREAWKAAKELEEARKAGTAPPAVDEEGKIINPHIPEYISQAPWYVSQGGPSLKHQRSQQKRKRTFDGLGKWLPRGQTTGPSATKYRKGACENCGAMTHTTKNCLERPRRRGAKLTGRDIRPDEIIGSVNLDFQGKRDRWNGYDEDTEYHRVHERYAKIEEERKALKEERRNAELGENTNGVSRKVSGENEDSDHSESGSDSDDGEVNHGEKGVKTSARNLRIREDTAKYLYNLRTDSAYYDPKSRAMRADPNPQINLEDKDYAGDNFVRYTGDVQRLARMELHTMRGNELGKSLPHLQAEPSRAEALFREFETKKKAVEEKRRTDILKKYGGQEHMIKEQGIEGVSQVEAHIGYKSDGSAIKAAKQTIPVSKYAEDELEKNHTEVFGSYYKNGKWGYACCHGTQRYAICTGEDGKQAALEVEQEMEQRVKDAEAKRDSRPLAELHQEKEKEQEENALPLEQAAEEERRKRREVEREMRNQQAEEEQAVADDQGKTYNSAYHTENPQGMSEAALEAYRLRRQVADDPMASFLSKKQR